MRKNIGILCLTLVMLVSLWMPGLAAEGAVIEVTVPSEPVKAGETFDVMVSIRNNPGFYAADFTLEYDQAIMNCSDLWAESLIAGTLYAANPTDAAGARLSLATTSGVHSDGLLFGLEFLALQDLESCFFRFSALNLSDSQGVKLKGITVHIPGTDSDAATQPDTEPESEVPGTEPSSEQPQAGSPDPSPAGQTGGAASGSGENPGSASGDLDRETGAETASEAPSFPDIKGHWAEKSIRRAAELGLIKGYEDGTFRPNMNITRAQFVTLLYRLAGSPETTEETPFRDVDDQIPEFRRAIAWAYQQGYVKGTGEDSFSPKATLTRQEAVTILFRYHGNSSGMELMFFSVYDEYYEDSAEVASWARNAMYWAIYQGMIKGTTETTLSPRGNATRAQLATILVYYMDTIMM